jgi:hypothetical protein
VSQGEFIGRVFTRYRHVHLTEIVPGCGWIDPRRPTGILRDRRNTEAPSIGEISAFRANSSAYAPFPTTVQSHVPSPTGRVFTMVDNTGPTGDPSTPILLSQLSGVVDFRAPVSDTPRDATTAFRQQPLMAAGVRGYIAAYGHPNDRLSRFVTAFDGVRLLPQSRFYSVFAYGSRRINACFTVRTAHCSASYVIHTAGRGLSTTTLRDGRYEYCVQAVTITDVSARRCVAISIQNHAAALAAPPRGQTSASVTVPGIAPTRYGLAAAATSSHDIDILGGYSRLTGWLHTVERYSITRHRWTLLPQLPIARFAPAAALGPNGGLYAIGGYSPVSGDTRRVDRLDPHTLRWSETTRIPTGRRYLAAVTDNGRIYAIGGYNPQAGAVSSVGAYNTTTRRWSAIAPLPIAAAGAAATVGNDGRIYVFGGWDEAHGILHRTQIYDPTTNTWTLGADMPVHRETAAATTAANGCIYVMGGDTIQAGSPTALREVDIYQPTTNTWVTGPPMLHARSSLAAATGKTDIYAIAGWDQGALASVERFPPLATSC